MAYTTIDKPNQYFNTILHTGNGTTPYSFTGVGFQPDWIWGKGRNNTFSHALFDSVRGVNKYLSSNGTGAEITNPTSGYLSSFDSDGFTAVAGTSNFANFNDNTINTPSTYVFWNWKANGAGVSNTSGTITSTVSANTTSGFSIVSYTGNATNGATVGHGLSSAPQMVITKKRGDSGNWQVLTNIYPNYSEGDFIYLSASDAKANSVNVSFLPTSTTWQMKAGQAGNEAFTQIAYCFHSVKGFSKFGSYTGNGSTDGTFVYTGFKPAFVMVKSSSAVGTWCMLDNARSTFNEANKIINAEDSAAEFTATGIDFIGNGFKHRNSNTNRNASGVTYIYMAFAENPFVSSKGIPTTAR